MEETVTSDKSGYLSQSNTLMVSSLTIMYSYLFCRSKPSNQRSTGVLGPTVMDFETTEFRSMRICR